MFALMLFAFIGGVVTILSPCILPILPIVLSSGLTGGHKRPLGVVAGFMASFTFFTLFLATIVQATGLSADFLRSFAVLIILSFGLVLVVPKLQAWWEQFASRLASRGGIRTQRTDFWGGVLIGLSLGLVWAPCVGPILASIITLAATGSINSTAVWVTLAYTLGTALPMLGLIYGGRRMLNVMPVLKRNSQQIQRVFGVLMLLTALGIFFNVDRKFQAFILEAFPSYGTGLTKLEDNKLVQQKLDALLDVSKTDRLKVTMDDRNYPAAPELEGFTEWLNSEPLTLQSLRGKVVLIDFWTYTCVNCIRTLPYLTAWHQAYADDGLVIIGVHAPEFEFEKEKANVLQAMADFGIEYPVVQDNDFAIWRAYENRYWPAKYLIDAQGRIRYTHFGEGDYEETEAMIRQLLDEAGKQPTGETADFDEFVHQTRTPETYLGYSRMAGLASLTPLRPDEWTNYVAQPNPRQNEFSLVGDWLVTEEYAIPKNGSSLPFKFDAKQVNLVMRSSDPEAYVLVKLDGVPIHTLDAGDDVTDSIVQLDEDRLYNLVSLSEAGEHILSLEFFSEGIEVFAFTFG